MDFFTLAIVLWIIITLMMLAGVAGAAWFARIWRMLEAKKLYVAQCDAAMAYPQFANPGEALDLRSHTFGGDKAAFEQYEWYVARLVYVLDHCLMLGPKARWRAVADTQLAAHKHYLASEYYAKQDYLPHYSGRMRRLIQGQRG